MTTRSAALATFALILVTGGGVAQATTSSPSEAHGVLFDGQSLVPGQSGHATITVPAASVATNPYLQVTNFQQHCAGATCATVRRLPALTNELLLTAKEADGNGATWTRVVARFAHPRGLPGGTIAADHDRTYRLTLTLPASAGNDYQDLAFSATFKWGGIDAAMALGKPGPLDSPAASTTVNGGSRPTAKAFMTLGEPAPIPRVGQPVPVAGPSIDDSVPFTGFDAFAAIVFAAEILGFSTLLAAAARRRRRNAPDKVAPR